MAHYGLLGKRKNLNHLCEGHMFYLERLAVLDPVDLAIISQRGGLNLGNKFMGYRRKKDDDAAMGCIVYGLLGLILMPIVGLFLAFSKDPEKRIWGWVLFAVGAALWLIIGIGGN